MPLKITSKFDDSVYNEIKSAITDGKYVDFDLSATKPPVSFVYLHISKSQIANNMYNSETDICLLPEDNPIFQEDSTFISKLHNALTKKYNVKSFGDILKIRSDDDKLEYLLTIPNFDNGYDDMFVCKSASIPFDQDTLKKNIAFLFDITEITLNELYSYLNLPQDSNLTAKLNITKLKETTFRDDAYGKYCDQYENYADAAFKCIDPKHLTVGYEDIGGCIEAINHLKDITYRIKHPEIEKELNLTDISNGIIFYGPPGTGKSLLAKAAAKEMDMAFINVKLSDILSKWQGESEQNISNIFRLAEKNAPTVLFFDEIDSLLLSRNTSNDPSQKILGTLLAEMDGVESKKDVIVMAATNRINIIDPAFLRPGRLGNQISVGLPDIDARKKIFEIHLNQKNTADDLDYSILAKNTDDFSGADIKGIVYSCDLGWIRAKRLGNPIEPISTDYLLNLITDYKKQVKNHETSILPEDALHIYD